MKTFLSALIVMLAWASQAVDTPIAVLKGSNVVLVTVADLTTYKNKVGESNVVITAAELVIKQGWSYSGGVFRDKENKPLPTEVIAKRDFNKKVDEVVASDATKLDAGKQTELLAKLVSVLSQILKFHPELLEPKPEQQ